MGKRPKEAVRSRSLSGSVTLTTVLFLARDFSSTQLFLFITWDNCLQTLITHPLLGGTAVVASEFEFRFLISLRDMDGSRDRVS